MIKNIYNLFTSIQYIFATTNRFYALRSDGSVVSWNGYSGDRIYEWDENLNEISLKAKISGVDEYTNIINISSNDYFANRLC